MEEIPQTTKEVLIEEGLVKEVTTKWSPVEEKIARRDSLVSSIARDQAEVDELNQLLGE
jgi:hypothetical protein